MRSMAETYGTACHSVYGAEGRFPEPFSETTSRNLGFYGYMRVRNGTN